jgi:hypothetical protein
METKNNTFNQLFKLTDKHVKSYRDDLIKHDFNSIEKRPGIKFIHITRKTGTCIVFLSDILKDLKEIQPTTGQTFFKEGTTTEEVIKLKKTFIDYYLENTTFEKVCFFDGNKVKAITADKAKNIFSDYCQSQRVNAAVKAEQEKRELAY